MRYLLLVPALALAACGEGATDPGEDPVPCAKQTDCGDDGRRACIDGVCSGQHPEPSLRNASISVPASIWLKSPKTLRAFTLYDKRVDGTKLTCDGAKGLLQPAAGSQQELRDPAKHNLVVSPAELNFPSSGDTLQTGFFVNSGSNLVYLEIYDAPLSEDVPPIGSACLTVPVDGLISGFAKPRP